MAKKAISKPKLKKYPPKPKAGASAEVLANYLKRCKEVDKDNAPKLSDYNKKVSKVKAEKKTKEGLKKKINSLGGVFGKRFKR